MAGDRENYLDDEAQGIVDAQLAEGHFNSEAEVLTAALELLETHNSEAAASGRKIFFEKMAEAESEMKANPEAWSDYIEERDAWLNANLGTP